LGSVSAGYRSIVLDVSEVSGEEEFVVSSRHPSGIVYGIRLVCDATGEIITEIDKPGLWSFVDYSWDCKSCPERHCSSCFYEEFPNGDIRVVGCGRFMK